MSYFYILAILVISIVDGFPLIKKGMWKELITFSSLIGISVIILIFKEFGFQTPLAWLNELLLPVGKTIFKYH